MKKFSLFAAAMAFATASMFSAPQNASAEWSNYFSEPGTLEVAFIEVAPGGVFVTFKTPPFPSTTCSSGTIWMLGGAPDTVSKLMTLITSSKLSGIKLKVHRPEAPAAGQADQRCSGGAKGWPLITNIMMG